MAETSFRTDFSVVDEGSPPAPPARFNLATPCFEAAARTPEKIALIVVRSVSDASEERRTTLRYNQLAAAIGRAAAGFIARGLRPGDRVMLRLGDDPIFPILFFGAIAAGGVALPTSAQLSTAEARFLIEDAEPRFLCVDVGREIAGAPVETLDAAEIAALLDTPNATEPVASAPDDPAYLVYTSGATGRPKGVLHAHRAAWARRMMWRDWYDLRSDDRVLHAGAFNWSYTLGTGLMDPWAIGATAITYNGEKDPGIWPKIAQRTGATLFAAVPSVFRQTLKYGENLSANFAALRHGLTAGEKLSDDTRSGWTAATGKPLYEALGMSECSTFISSSPTTPPRAGCAGRPQRGRRVAILTVEGEAVPAPLGETGMLAVDRRDPGLMLGYWRRPDEEAAMMRGDWFVTGDLAEMDADGYVAYRGRADDLMNAMGYRVAPQEVEEALASHPAVAECAAAPLRVKAGVEVIAGFVVLRENDAERISSDALIRHCVDRLATYKTPREIIFLDALPRTPNGKIRRRALSERFNASEN